MFANKHSLPVWPVGQLELELGRLAPPLPEQIQPSDSVGYLYGIRSAARAKSDRRGRDRTHGPHAGEPEDSESAHVYCLVVDWLLTEASFQTKSERVLFRISPPRRHGRAT